MIRTLKKKQGEQKALNLIKTINEIKIEQCESILIICIKEDILKKRNTLKNRRMIMRQWAPYIKRQSMNTEKLCESKQESCAIEPYVYWLSTSNWSFPLTLGALITETVAWNLI